MDLSKLTNEAMSATRTKHWEFHFPHDFGQKADIWKSIECPQIPADPAFAMTNF